MKSLFVSIISSITYSLVSILLGDEEIENPHILNQAVHIIYQKILMMPTYLMIPMMILTIAFDWYGFITTGRRFHSQLPLARQNQITRWKNSRLGVFQDFIQFYETLTFFIYYSNKSKLHQK